MAALTEWLLLMLAEIARKREDAERALDEESRRQAEQTSRPSSSATPADVAMVSSRRVAK
jgi:hypothetical protein